MENKTKLCGSCKNDFILSDENFAKSIRSKDGFANICKTCKREYDKKYREKNKKKIADSRVKYHEKNREKLLLKSKKWRDENKDYLQQFRAENREDIKRRNKEYWAKNKEDEKIRIKKWRQENADHIKRYRKINRDRDKEAARKWYRTERGRSLSITRTNQRRAKIKKLRNDFTAKQWSECLNHFEYNCAYCGKHYELLEQEHFVPVSKNGHFTKSNIVPACKSCNTSKSNKSFFDWYPKQKHYSIERENKILSYLGRDQHDSLQIQ